MDRSTRIDGGAILAVAGALAVLVSLFLDWFKPSLSAWTVFETLDLVLAAIALAVLAISGTRLIRGANALKPATEGVWLPVLAGTAFVIVVAALLNHPPAAIGLGVKAGAWVALAGSLLMLLGALAGRAHVSLSFSYTRPEPGRPVEPPPASQEPPPPPAGDTGTQALDPDRDA